MSDLPEPVESDLFEVMYTMRAMRRLKPDPVPDAVLRRVLDAAIRAPSGQNTQAWKFVVLRSAERKAFFGERYLAGMRRAFEGRLPADDDDSPWARTMRAGVYLAEHMHEAPAIILCCGLRDWPFRVPPEQRVGKAPPSYGSVYPAVQNLLLACRAMGLGASLTTLHQVFEDELCAEVGIPDEYGVVASIPVGYPQGRFGPVRRQPIEEHAYVDDWGTPLFEAP